MAASITGASSTGTGATSSSIEGVPLQRASGLILVLDTPKGRGVFASKDIPSRTILEVCPVLVLDPVENEIHIKETELYHYTYNWPYTPPIQHQQNPSINPQNIPRKALSGSSKPPTTTQAVILGLGSMFNHSVPHQNVGWDRDVVNKLMTYTALRDIKAGEELCICYGQRLTFKDAEEEDHVPAGSEDWAEVMNYIDYIG